MIIVKQQKTAIKQQKNSKKQQKAAKSSNFATLISNKNGLIYYHYKFYLLFSITVINT